MNAIRRARALVSSPSPLSQQPREYDRRTNRRVGDVSGIATDAQGKARVLPGPVPACFRFQARPVVPVMDAVSVELEANGRR
jgi:hypothetical protein